MPIITYCIQGWGPVYAIYNILTIYCQYMQYYNILLPEANIAIYMVCQRRILQYIWCIALRGYNILQYCSIWLQCIAILLNTSSPCFDAYIYNYTHYIRFKATSIYNVAFTNAFTHPFVYICIFKCISYMLNNAHPTHTRQDKSRVLTRIYAAIRVAPDLKPSLFAMSRLQTRSRIHLSIYVYSNAFHIWSTTFIQPICAKINRAYRCVYIQPYTLHQI